MSKKTTKRALAMSFVSVFLCVCMLVGTTFAWFTDSVTSSNNVIKSGTLDVTMEWKDATTTGAQQSYKDASEGAIFDYDLWEPGYVEAKNIQIKNAGTLALKYQLNIVANGEASDLTDVIDVYYVDGETVMNERADMSALTHLGTLTEVLADMSTTASGNLEANAAHTVTIALKMQEDATNEYQGLSIGSDFSVVLMATQKDYESDSFDSTYDKIEVPEMDIKVIDGNTYHYLDDGNVVLASVPYGNVGATFTVPNDVTVLGQGDVYDGAVPVFSKSSPIESITLPEGLVEIKARAITGVKTLTSINFPSTLKAIRAQALRQTGMDELTIPANVEVIGDGAFRDMANLTTVTIEGNVEIGDYAFRSCPNLSKVYLKGDDVTFAGTSMAFTHSDNGDATGITIYVKNTTVAARVYAAQSSAYGYEVKILGTAADDSDATEVAQVKTSAALDAAITGGAKNIVLAAGTYEFPSIPAGTTIVGQDGVVFEDTLSGTLDNVTIKNVDIKASNAQRWAYSKGTLVFEDCTFEATGVYAIHYDGLNGANITYKNCTIIGWAAIGSGAEHVTFDGCKIYGNGSYGVIRLYSPGTITNCTFDVASVNTTDVYQDGIHAVDCEIKVSNNTNVNGAMIDLYNLSGTGVITEQ